MQFISENIETDISGCLIPDPAQDINSNPGCVSGGPGLRPTLYKNLVTKNDGFPTGQF